MKHGNVHEFLAVVSKTSIVGYEWFLIIIVILCPEIPPLWKTVVFTLV